MRSPGLVRGRTHWKLAAYAMTPRCSTSLLAISLALRIGSTPSRLPPWMPGAEWCQPCESTLLPTVQSLNARIWSVPVLRLLSQLSGSKAISLKPGTGPPRDLTREQRARPSFQSRCKRTNRCESLRHMLKQYHSGRKPTVKLCTGFCGIWLLTQRSVAWKPGEFSFMKYDR